ncbi:MAG TPA: hypothetical protein VNY82_01545 [Steroidobacteraceae bacterium]|nr:hypothetical protein [Steroidobacteraceae bacterium]
MNRYPDVAHCATALVNVPAAKAFEFLADPLSLGTWSLGCMRTHAAKSGAVGATAGVAHAVTAGAAMAAAASATTAAEGPYTGTSLYDDSLASFDIRPHPELLLIDYLVGDAGNLKPRNSVRVIAGDTCDLSDAQCYVSLMAWRPARMEDDRWAQLCAAHDAEIWIIKARIEGAGRAPGAERSL